jgi:hypothetical protein
MKNIKKYLNSIKLKLLKLLGKQDKKITYIPAGRGLDATTAAFSHAAKHWALSSKNAKGGKKHLKKHYNID